MSGPKGRSFKSNPLVGAFIRLARGSSTLLVAASLLLLIASSLAMAQTSGSATLRGTIKDPDGALVGKAAVTLTSEATKAERRTITNDEGLYQFSSVLPGSYTVKVEASGFKTLEQTKLVLVTSDTRGMDFTLTVGAANEVLTVVATAEPIQKETGSKESTISAKQIDNLSIISRSSLELLRILPGVVAPDRNDTDVESVSFGGGANANNAYHVNGLRGENNNVTIDGSRVIDIGANNGTAITANPDFVQEVKIQTSNYAAEHGAAGVQISATTKGGSGGFHGGIYDYIRNYRLNANDRSSNYADIPRGASSYNYPGGNISGPVLFPGSKFNKNRDKMFFFVGFEYYHQRIDDGAFLTVTPTAKQRQGDFSELLTGPRSNLNQGRTVNVPLGCTVNGATVGQPAPNNNLAPCLDPTGRALLNLFPLPNFVDERDNRYNYVYNVIRPLDRNQLIGRLDYNVTDNTRLYVRLAREYETVEQPRGLWWASSNYELPSHVQQQNLGRSVSTSIVSTLSPTMTNEIVISGSRLLLDNDYKNPEKVSYETLGIPRIGPFTENNQIVPVNIIDAWGGGIGGNLYTAYALPLFAHNDSYSISDNLSKVVNSHALKFGFTIEQANKTQSSQQGTAEITLAQWGEPNGTGNNYGDLVVGRPYQVGLSTPPPIGHFRFYNYEFYGQDSWKIRPNFTLEYGLRLAFMPLNFERNGLAVRFDRDRYDQSQGLFINGDRTRPNGVLLASRGEIPASLTESPSPRLMPRLNFAWDVNGKGDTVIRGGAGIFYNRVQGNYDYYSLTQPPNTYSAIIDTWAQGTDLTFNNIRNVDPFTRLAAVNLTSRNPDSIEHPQTINMSLSVARRFKYNQVLEVAYVGTLGRHLPQNHAINFIPVGGLLSGRVGNSDLSDPIQRAALNTSVIRQFKPFPAYQNVTYNQFDGTSNYHSLQMTLSRQSGSRLQYFATYTFSKALGTTAINETDGAAFVDPIDTRGRSWGVLGFDRTHVFNVSYNLELPNLARGGFDNGVTRTVFNGWQMSGITTFQSGNPIRLRFTGDLASTQAGLAWYGTDAFILQGNNTGAITPIYLGDPRVSEGKKVRDRIIDINALAIPSFGNSGPFAPPFYLRTPSRSNFDVSFFKNINFNETKRLQFRAGLFNVFNQAYPTRIDVTNSNNSDIYLTLNTVCNRRVSGVPDGTGGTTGGTVCDPQGGYSFTQDTINNFGRILTKRGHRIIEFALKYYF